MNERWLPVIGFEAKYEVSDQGHVKSLYSTQKLMALHTHWCGYKVIWLRSPGKHKKFFVHRLVAMAFLPNPEKKEIVNHKDGNKANNILSNLEWNTQSENVTHYYRQLKPARKSEDIDPESVPI